jgi:hypothetical protein
LKSKPEESINEPFLAVFAQGIVKKKAGETIFLISKAIPLIFRVVFLIEAVASLISSDPLAN